MNSGQPATDGGGLIRLRLEIAYDGSEFHGWAKQRGLRTVQGTLEELLTHLFRQPVELTCAGRTDAGVHARGQVAHLDVTEWDPEIDVRRINRALDDDVRVTAIQEVSTDFDARFSAIWRRYTYTVCDDPRGPDPLTRRHTYFSPRPLDLDAMNAAARPLHGEHDFASFCKLREFASTVRRIMDLHWERDSNGLAVMHVQADAFCHSMVRSLVGALLPVGEGRWSVSRPEEALRKTSRDAGIPVLPPHPLVLEGVGYPTDDQLLARQVETRTLRSLQE